ncbi:MAG: hypothetical protein WBA16_08045 [Nonlabens sp.]
MKNTILLLIAILLGSYNLNGQINPTDPPPGTLKINDSLYIDSSPITISMGYEYGSYLKSTQR